MLFGLGVSTAANPGADPVKEARRAEELGFDFVSASDHLHGSSPTFEPWTLLSWIAAGTSQIRVATRVLGLPYRSPPVVAKMAETLDRLSGGRLILGLGGGYSDEEFRAFGLGTWTSRDKIDGLEEAIRIARGLWAEESFTFPGRRYRIQEAELEPKPEHGIPIWLGTYGSRALALTGRLADGWIPSHGMVGPEELAAMRHRVMTAARQAGRRPEDVTCIYNVEVCVGRADPGESVVSGVPEVVAERLSGFARMGFQGFNFLPVGPGREEQAVRLADEVIPALRETVW
ncbi:MAG: LLM class flavin-dependent oxidoreductase [Actinomycetota bacterium]|nr:LLM class flavin-dependent oxidoreductase [Actinomycetota bacterium]